MNCSTSIHVLVAKVRVDAGQVLAVGHRQQSFEVNGTSSGVVVESSGAKVSRCLYFRKCPVQKW